MTQYTNYKDSGIFWTPRIPSGWETTYLRYILHKENREKDPDSELLICSNSGHVIKRGDSKQGLVAESNDVYQGVKKGDLLIHGMDTWHGAIGISGFDGMCTPVVHVCTSSQNIRFVAYYLKMMANAKVFKLISNGVRQNTSDFRSWDKVARLPIFLPSIEEQDKIVEYLDHKISLIESFNKQKENELQLLNEIKIAFISSAVSHGLDPNVPMKDSGIPMVGQIPAHWDVEPFGRHFTYGKGLPITKADLVSEGLAVISYGQIHSKRNNGSTITKELIRRVSSDYLKTHPQCILQPNDFVFADTSEDIEGSGNFAFNDYSETLFAGYHTLIARPKDLLLPKYYAFLFQSVGWKSQVQSMVNGVKVFSIGRKHLKNTSLLIPPLNEQSAIVNYLEGKTKRIDAMIQALQDEIDYLAEYKQRLIWDVVTGQVNVNKTI